MAADMALVMAITSTGAGVGATGGGVVAVVVTRPGAVVDGTWGPALVIKYSLKVSTVSPDQSFMVLSPQHCQKSFNDRIHFFIAFDVVIAFDMVTTSVRDALVQLIASNSVWSMFM